MKTDLIPDALYWASFNHFSLRLPGECVADCSHSGHCDSDIEFWVNDPRVKWESGSIYDRNPPSADAIRAELKEHGAWDADELADDAQNRRRILWIAAGNISEDESPDCSAPLVPSGETGPFRDISI